MACRPGAGFAWSRELPEAGKGGWWGETKRQADNRDVTPIRNEMSELRQLVAELSLKGRVLDKSQLG